VNKVTDCWLDDRRTIPGRESFSSPKRPDGRWGPLALSINAC
jgi:hypothetical protein